MDEVEGKGTIFNACYVTVSAVLINWSETIIQIRTYPFCELSDSIWGANRSFRKPGMHFTNLSSLVN